MVEQTHRIDFVARRGGAVGHGYVAFRRPDGRYDTAIGRYPSDTHATSGISSIFNTRTYSGILRIEEQIDIGGRDTIIASIEVTQEQYNSLLMQSYTDVTTPQRYDLILGQHCLYYMDQVAQRVGTSIYAIADARADPGLFNALGCGAV
jgi:hypothetical protein